MTVTKVRLNLGNLSFFPQQTLEERVRSSPPVCAAFSQGSNLILIAQAAQYEQVHRQRLVVAETAEPVSRKSEMRRVRSSEF